MKNATEMLNTNETIKINLTAAQLVNRGWVLDTELIGSDRISIQFRDGKTLVCATDENNDTYEVGTIETQHADILADLQAVINF